MSIFLSFIKRKIQENIFLDKEQEHLYIKKNSKLYIIVIFLHKLMVKHLDCVERSSDRSSSRLSCSPATLFIKQTNTPRKVRLSKIALSVKHFIFAGV